MGWDAYAKTSDGRFIDREDPEVDRSILEEFKEASKRVTKMTGSADGLLENGGLDVSNCAEMLEKATGRSAWEPDGWDVDTVKRLAANADWNFTYDQGDNTYYFSAKEFLETCARFGLAIDFYY